jgi:hypothetical protein
VNKKEIAGGHEKKNMKTRSKRRKRRVEKYEGDERNE